MTITGDVKRQLSYETFFNLPEKVKDSLLALYNIPELEFYDTYYALKRENYSPTIIREKLGDETLYDVEALKVSAEITSALYMVFSADHYSDYKKDIANYDALVEEANTRYGEILVQSNEARRNGWGFIGHRRASHSVIETTKTEPGKNPVSTIEYVSDKIHEEDEKLRSQYENEII
jgi:hypothetical protein